MSIAEAENVLLFSPLAATPQLEGISAHFFSNWPPDSDQMTKLASYAATAEMRCIAVLVQDMQGSVSCSKCFADEFVRQGGRIPVWLKFSTRGADIGRLIVDHLDELKQVDGILLMGWPEEMGRAAKEVRFRLDAPLLAYCDIKDIDAVNSGGAAINDVIYANPVFNADVIGPHSRVFVDRFKQRTGASPTLEDACCYDAVMLLADSMKSGHTTADAIGQMLRELQGYDGVAGRLQFTKGVVRGHYEISRVKPI